MSTDAPSPGMADLHNHLVPGVDDGSRSVEEALESVEALAARGVHHIVTTPHFRASLTRTPERFGAALQAMDEGWDRISTEVAHHFPDLTFERGHELLLDVPDPDLSDPRLRLADSTAVLVEWANFRIPPETARSLRRLREGGVVPVLAHPERYQGYRPGGVQPDEWRDEGALLQVNLGSFTGAYGPEARERAFRLLSRGWIDLLATDFHGRREVQPVVTEAKELFHRHGGEEQWTVLTEVNPRRVLADQPPYPVPPLEIKDGFVARVRRLLRDRA